MKIVSLMACLLFTASVCAAQTTSPPVTSLDQQISIWDSLIQTFQSGGTISAAQLRSAVPQYGNYCGLQSTSAGAIPVDCLDAACMQHDLSAGYSASNPTLSQVVAADRAFIWALENVRATTAYGELYRIEAIDLFTTKTDYEQANDTTLVTNCADCKPAQ